jgi:hypothetical protein
MLRSLCATFHIYPAGLGGAPHEQLQILRVLIGSLNVAAHMVAKASALSGF